MSKNFALIGAAGYVAPKHMKAIKENNGVLLAATDPNDSVGIIDSYFPDSSFFTEIERFDRHVYKAIKTKNKIDYFSICSPNYLHDAHIRMALRNDAFAICEKPLILDPKNIKYLKNLEDDSQKKIYTVLQLRYHDKIIALREHYKNISKKVSVDLRYITSRGEWYKYSWKGNKAKSGGLAANIGIHFFDMLIWIFGDPISNEVLTQNELSISGTLTLKNANINWFLSIDREELPNGHWEDSKPSFRQLIVDGREVEFSNGFTDLHTVAYRNILNNNGFGVDDTYISLCIARDVSLGVGMYKY
jgi:UDP-N-acetyl-2-amino-2-deoxyglucuronate dehydrogenase